MKKYILLCLLMAFTALPSDDIPTGMGPCGIPLSNDYIDYNPTLNALYRTSFISNSSSTIISGIVMSVATRAAVGVAGVVASVAFNAAQAGAEKLKGFMKNNDEYRAEINVRISPRNSVVIEQTADDAFNNLTLQELELLAQNEEHRKSGTFFRNKLYNKRVALHLIDPTEY
jgi:hypothetical protein